MARKEMYVWQVEVVLDAHYIASWKFETIYEVLVKVNTDTLTLLQINKYFECSCMKYGNVKCYFV